MNDTSIESLTIDPRIQRLSYSSLLTLHSCPRKFQLYKLQAQEQETDSDGTQNITFAFGHVIGEAIASVIAGVPYNQVILNLFLGWHADILEEDTKRNKSFWEAMLAVDKIISLTDNGFLKDWELVYYQGKPAVELSFRVTLPDGFYIRGFVDAVLQHKVTGKIRVLENKTSSGVLNPATYKNSAQAIGYSVVLDTLFPELSAYEVQYLVYLTKTREYETLIFNKSFVQRALWLKELLLDIETIKMYEEAGTYPMRGESCFSWYRECEYLQVCSLDTRHFIKELEEPLELETFQIELSIYDLINTQVAKSKGA